MFVALGLAWSLNGQGVIKPDHDRHIQIPDKLTLPFRVRAAHNGERIFFQYRWPADRPGIHMDVLKFEGGKWVKYSGQAWSTRSHLP